MTVIAKILHPNIRVQLRGGFIPVPGPQGPAGNDGAQGPPGNDGVQGLQGDPGIDGNTSIDDSITNGITDRAPSQNAVYDALTTKQDALGFTPVPNTRTINSLQLNADITISKSDVGLANVDNTSDVNKPVSTAQATADAAVLASAIQRANHTGSQLASTISDFNSAALLAAPAETATSEGALINGATSKSTPVDTDYIGLMDSAASNVLKKLSWASIKATLKTYFDDLYLSLSGGSLTGALNEAQGADIPSATNINLGAASGNYVNITGTTTIVNLGTASAGAKRRVKFTGSLTLTHNSTSLDLPGGVNIVTYPGDRAVFVSLGSTNWILTDFLSNDPGTWRTDWTLSPTGCSTDPVIADKRYRLVDGKTCFLMLTYSVVGVSNNSSHTIQLPFVAAVTCHIECRMFNGSAFLTAPAMIRINAGSSTADIFKDFTGAANPSSGNWGIIILAGSCYEIQ